MQASIRCHGPSPQAFVIVPIVGAFFIDLINLTVLAFYRKPFSSLRKNRLVAVALRRLWTRTSRTFPS